MIDNYKLTGCKLVLALCIFFTSHYAVSQNVRSAFEVMQDMLDASAKTNYSGLATYEKSGRLKTLQFTHLSRSGKTLERTVRLDGPIGDDYLWREQDCALYNDSIQFGVFASGKSTNLAKLSQLYTFELRGQHRVANRLSTAILVNPKDQFRLPYLITVDNQSDLMLKSVILDNEGKPLERLQFVNIQIGGELDTLEVSADAIAPCQETSINGALASYQPSWIPPGYTSVLTDLDPRLNQTMTTFSDGLASFSVFVESAQISAMLPPFLSSSGATSAVSIKVDIGASELTVSVVGEISMETAEKIARSVVPASEIRQNP